MFFGVFYTGNAKPVIFRHFPPVSYFEQVKSLKVKYYSMHDGPRAVPSKKVTFLINGMKLAEKIKLF
jgi:hypothetical protein